MRLKLKQGIQQFYSEQQLDDKQFEQLNCVIREGNIEPQNQPGKNNNDGKRSFWRRQIPPRFRVQGSIAAAVACISLALLISFTLTPNSANVQDVAAEVASNHRHLKPLTLQSSSYPQLRLFFSDLNFQLKPSNLLDKQRWKLLGGRYCSINGIKAAQLRLLDTEDNSVQTFYQLEHKTSYFENIPNISHNELPLSVSIDGVPVEVWSEGGILYSLTHSPD